MTYIRKCNILFFLLFVIIEIGCQHKPINVYDDFEARKLSKIWTTDRMERRAFELQSNIVRNGSSAAKITLLAGDKAEPSSGKNNKESERDELQEDDALFSVEGTKYEQQFSIFLPDTFPVVPVRLVLAQWKQYCYKCKCSNYSPVLALRYVSGKMFVTLQIDSTRRILWESRGEMRNRWFDFKFLTRFSRQNNGEIQVYLYDKEIVDYHGITSYDELCSPIDKNYYYFKMGLYRDKMPEPMTIYIDDYRKKEIEEEGK